MNDSPDKKQPRISRAAQRASQSQPFENTESPGAEAQDGQPVLPLGHEEQTWQTVNPRDISGKKAKNPVSLIISGCCLLIFFAFVFFPGAMFGLLWNSFSGGYYDGSNQNQQEQSANVPAVQSFLDEVGTYTPTVSRFQVLGRTVGAYGMNCPDDGDPSGDACYYFEVKGLTEPDDERACLETFKIAEKFGVKRDVTIGEYKGEEYGEGSLARCKTMLSSYPRSVGWGWFGPEYYIKGTTDKLVPWVMLLTRSQETSAKPSNNNKNGKLNTEEYGYTITIGTNFGNAYAGENLGPHYSENKVQAAAMLDTIAYYRRSNKPLGFFTKALVDQVLPIYKQTFRFDGAVKSFADSDGSIHWVQMNFMDGVTWCVSIGEGKDLTTGGDETLGMGMDETGLPGGTVELAGLGNVIKSRTQDHRFGDYVVGECK